MKVAVFAAVTLVLSGIIAALTRPFALALEKGTAYDVAVQGSTAMLELPAAQEPARHLLIVANLAREPLPQQVTIRVESCPVSVPRGLLRVARLPDPPMRPPAAALPRRTMPARCVPHRTFWLNMAPSSPQSPDFVAVHGRLMRAAGGVAVYLDQSDCPRGSDGAPLPTATLEVAINQIVQNCATDVVPRIERFFGPIQDLDGSGGISVVLTSKLAALDGGRTSVGGLTQQADFSACGLPDGTGACDVVFLNAQVRPGGHLQSLLAHELAHAAVFSHRARQKSLSDARAAEDWLNEGLAHVAENLAGGGWTNLDYRLEAYLAAPESAPLVVPRYADYGLWRAAGTRGATYLFLRWCAHRRGTDVLRELTQSPRGDVPSLETAAGAPFEDLFREYLVELACGTTPWRTAEFDGPDLRGAVGNCQLAGPHVVALDLHGAQPALRFMLAGTAAKFLHICSPAGRGARIAVQAEPGARLQVTLVPLSGG